MRHFARNSLASYYRTDFDKERDHLCPSFGSGAIENRCTNPRAGGVEAMNDRENRRRSNLLRGFRPRQVDKLTNAKIWKKASRRGKKKKIENRKSKMTFFVLWKSSSLMSVSCRATSSGLISTRGGIANKGVEKVAKAIPSSETLSFLHLTVAGTSDAGIFETTVHSQMCSTDGPDWAFAWNTTQRHQKFCKYQKRGLHSHLLLMLENSAEDLERSLTENHNLRLLSTRSLPTKHVKHFPSYKASEKNGVPQSNCGAFPLATNRSSSAPATAEWTLQFLQKRERNASVRKQRRHCWNSRRFLTRSLWWLLHQLVVSCENDLEQIRSVDKRIECIQKLSRVTNEIS